MPSPTSTRPRRPGIVCSGEAGVIPVAAHLHDAAADLEIRAGRGMGHEEGLLGAGALASVRFALDHDPSPVDLHRVAREPNDAPRHEAQRVLRVAAADEIAEARGPAGGDQHDVTGPQARRERRRQGEVVRHRPHLEQHEAEHARDQQKQPDDPGQAADELAHAPSLSGLSQKQARNGGSSLAEVPAAISLAAENSVRHASSRV
jgi:hypothetical protein